MSNILSNSTFGKAITSLRKSEQNMELQGKPATKMVPSVETEQKMPPTSSLKRKTLEAKFSFLLLSLFLFYMLLFFNSRI